ncbi:MAG: DUF4359 domain-containing protein [Xenococcus sp. (in: cyanobacteria)]
MVFTNPSKNQYVEYSSTELCHRLKNPYKTVCRGTLYFHGKSVKKIIEVSTDKKNLLVGSIYTTEIPGVKVHTVAMFGNFFTLR